METTSNVHWNEGDIVEEHNERDEELCAHEPHIDLYNEHGDSYHQVLYKQDLHELYEEQFGEALAEYNAKQTKKCRRMTMDEYMQSVADDNRGKKQTRKTADGKRVTKEDARQGKQVRYEFNVSVGNTNRLKDDDGRVIYDENNHHIRVEYLPRDLQNRALVRYANTFQDHNPNLILQGVYEHGDEGFVNKRRVWEYSVIHLHLIVVPIAHGFKRGLSVQNSMNKAMAEMGFDTSDCYHKWAAKENDRLNAILEEEYVKYCKEHPDFYDEKGDLHIYTPVKDKNKRGGITKDQYAREQEIDEQIAEVQYMNEQLTEEKTNFITAIKDASEQLNAEIDENNARRADLDEREVKINHVVAKIKSTLEDATGKEYSDDPEDLDDLMLDFHSWLDEVLEQEKQNQTKLKTELNRLRIENEKWRKEEQIRLQQKNNIIRQQQLKAQDVDVQEFQAWKKAQSAISIKPTNTLPKRVKERELPNISKS